MSLFLSILIKVLALGLYLCVAFLLQHSHRPLLNKVGRIMAAPLVGNYFHWKKECPR